MSCVFISEDANDLLKAYLSNTGNKVIEIRKTDSVYEAVSSHVDIYLCNIENFLVVAKEQIVFIKEKLNDMNIKYRIGNSVLGYKYPGNIIYNGACVGRHFIHNLKYTDKILLKMIEEKGYNVINVLQGYSKCNMVVVDYNSVITSDKGLEKELKKYKIEVLLIRQGYVRLKGFDYGFLGGASGRVGDTIVFNGDLKQHPDYLKIKEFIESKGLKIVSFKEYPLEDIGSIIEIE